MAIKWTELPNGTHSAYAGVIPLSVEFWIEVGAWRARVNGILLIGSKSPTPSGAKAAAEDRARKMANDIISDLNG